MCNRYPDASAALDGREFECFGTCERFPSALGDKSGDFDRTAWFCKIHVWSSFILYRIRLFQITSTNCDPSVPMGLRTDWYHDVDIPLPFPFTRTVFTGPNTVFAARKYALSLSLQPENFATTNSMTLPASRVSRDVIIALVQQAKQALPRCRERQGSWLSQRILRRCRSLALGCPKKPNDELREQLCVKPPSLFVARSLPQPEHQIVSRAWCCFMIAGDCKEDVHLFDWLIQRTQHLCVFESRCEVHRTLMVFLLLCCF